MIKTFFVGVVLGLIASAGAIYAIPAVDQVREASIITVAPNGGNVEAFHANIPMDRIMIGASGQTTPVPPSLRWPDVELLADVRTEMFKIRNERDSVVGVAVRTAAKNGDQDVIDWVLHLPARGSVFVNMNAVPHEGGYRIGEIRAGSREFAPLSGFMSERWVADTSEDEDAPAGRIELQATYVGELEPMEPTEQAE